MSERRLTVRPPCGSEKAYQWHRRHKEPADPECRAAHSEYQTAYLVRRKANGDAPLTGRQSRRKPKAETPAPEPIRIVLAPVPLPPGERLEYGRVVPGTRTVEIIGQRSAECSAADGVQVLARRVGPWQRAFRPDEPKGSA